MLDYLVLRLRYDTSYAPLIDVIAAPWEQPSIETFRTIPLGNIAIPDSLRDNLDSVLASRPWQQGPHTTGRSPLAIFIDAEDRLFDSVAAALVIGLRIDPNLVQFVLLPPRRWSRASHPFSLPLRIAAATPAVRPLLAHFEAKEWVESDPDVREFGVKIEDSPSLDPYQAADVILAEHFDDLPSEVLEHEEMRPRLVLLVDEYGPVESRSVPSGVSVVVLRDQRLRAPELMTNVIYAVAHDLWLPELVKSAMRQVGVPPHEHAEAAQVIADPASADNLRLSEAMAVLLDLRRQVMQYMPEFERPATQKLLIDDHPLIHQWAETAAEARAAMRGVLSQPLDRGYMQESEGLVPMSRAWAQLMRARAHVQQLRILGTSIGELDPFLRTRIEEKQQRKVDIALARTPEPFDTEDYIAEREKLNTGQRYSLLMRIGRKFGVSLVADDLPPIDFILPPAPHPAGHLLDVVVYPLDFTLVDRPLQTLLLPPEGPTETLRFNLTAPAASGPASLRVALYYASEYGEEHDHNHLVQAFLFRTEVVAGWRIERASEPVTKVTLEFSRTTEFRNLSALGRRALSIGVNESAGGTHTMMVKDGKKRTTQFSFPPQFLNQALKDARDELLKVGIDPPAPGETLPTARFPINGLGAELTFDGALTTLAAQGWALWNKVFGRQPADLRANAVWPADVLSAIRDLNDMVVQVVRFDQSFYFPWNLLYDFPFDTTVGKVVPVCKGFQRFKADGKRYTCGDCLSKCLYPDKTQTVCAYGFWGMRLQVEQLLYRGQEHDDDPTIDPLRDGGVGIVAGVGLPIETKTPIAQELQQSIGKRWISSLEPPQDVFDILWSDEKRPAIIIVLGHYRTSPKVGEPAEPRIAISGNRWLTVGELNRAWATARRGWGQPQSVVLVAACDSAGEDLTQINGFISAFGLARAGAVVGTETSVFESLARRFARSVAGSLVGGTSLGSALLAFRRELLHDLNPLGLVFTPYGDADLHREN